MRSTREKWALSVTAALFAAFLFTACAPQGGTSDGRGDGLELVVLHTNDTHSFLAGMDDRGNASLDGRNSSGGIGRAAAAMKAARLNRDNVIALDAGDQFQGTLFYSVNKWPMIAEVDRVVPWDAMTLGNHEFDEGCAELSRFLKQTPVPVLAANLTPEAGCPLRGSGTRAHLVKMVRGEKVGIVGLANDEVKTLSAACGHTAFSQARDTLEREVKALEAQGVKHIVAITHLGLPEDRRLARSVTGVDVIVGGHTHSYLGLSPSDGPYPVVEHAPNGDPVLVVTAGRGAKYLGELTVRFDGRGVPCSWSGSAVELSSDMPVDPEVQRLIDRYAATLTALRAEVVGSQRLSLPDGMELCREGGLPQRHGHGGCHAGIRASARGGGGAVQRRSAAGGVSCGNDYAGRRAFGASVRQRGAAAGIFGRAASGGAGARGGWRERAGAAAFADGRAAL